MIPPGLENAPEWVQNLFYGIMALGASYFGIKKIMTGARDEARIVRATGRTSTVEEVIDGAPEPRAKSPETFGILGGTLINRQMAEDHLDVGRKLVNVLERLEKLAERSLTMQERRHERDEESDRRDEIREEALKVLKETGLQLGEGGVLLPAERPGQRPPRRG